MQKRSKRKGDGEPAVEVDIQPGSKRTTAPKSRSAYYFTLLIACGSAAAALACLAVSFVSYATVIRAVYGTAPDPSRVRIGAEVIHRIFPDVMIRLRICAAGFGLAALLVGIFRRRFQTWMGESVCPLPWLLANAARSFIGELRSDGSLNVGLLLAFCVLGTILRVRFLFQPVSFDEADTLVVYASRPLFVALTWYTVPNNHLFHTLLLHFVWRVFGDAEWAIRLPALFAGILLIPATYWAARTLYNRHVALMSAALAATASSLVSYSVNGRGYTMLCVLFLFLLIASRSLLESDSRPVWFLWALIAALGFYTIPIMLYAVGAAALWMVLSSSPMQPAARRIFLGRLFAALAATGILTTLLYLPVLLVSGPRPLFANSYVRPRSFAYLFEHLPGTLERTWNLMTADLSGPLLWVLVVAFAAGLVFHRRIAAHRIPILLAALLWITPVVFVQRVTPFGRVWLFLLPVCLIVTCGGLWLLVRAFAGSSETRSSRLSAAVAACCFLLVGGATLYGDRLPSRSTLPGIKDLTVWMKGRLAPGDVIFAEIPSTAPLAYYFRRNGIRMVGQPAPCDGLSAMYSFRGSFSPQHAGAGKRILALVADQRQTLKSVLAIACLDNRTTTPARLLYTGEGIKLYETRMVAPGGPKQ